MVRSLMPFGTQLRPTVRILFFPHAGGTAVHARPWATQFSPTMQLLGVRYSALDAPASHGQTAQVIAKRIAEDLVTQLAAPLIFFGYSLGALIAYELSVELARRGIHAPADLVVAAARAPDLPRTEPPAATLSDAELICRLRRYGGTPEALLQDHEVINAVLPAVRADCAIADDYRFADSTPPLLCPITAIAGSRDELANAAAVAAWNSHTARSFTFHQLEGGHFFLHEQPEVVMGIVRALAQRRMDQDRIA